MNKPTKTKNVEEGGAGFQILVKPYKTPQKQQPIIPSIHFEDVLQLRTDVKVDKWGVVWSRLKAAAEEAGKPYFTTSVNGEIHSTNGCFWNWYKGAEGKPILLSDTIGFIPSKPQIHVSQVLISPSEIGGAENELSWSCYARTLKFTYYAWKGKVCKIQDPYTHHIVDYLTEDLEEKTIIEKDLLVKDLLGYKAPTEPATLIGTIQSHLKPLIKKHPKGKLVIQESPEAWTITYRVHGFKWPAYQARFANKSLKPKWDYTKEKSEIVSSLNALSKSYHSSPTP